MIFSIQALTLIGMIAQGITAASLGCFLLLKKESLLIDALSHACFPGIAFSYMFSPYSTFFSPLLGGLVSASLGYILISSIKNNTTLKRDTALGIVLSSFFGAGLVILTVVQKYPIEAQGRLRAYLFGNITVLLPEDIYGIILLALIVLSVLFFMYRSFISYTFDQVFATVHRIHKPWHDLLFKAIILLTILCGLQTSGIILTSALIIAPAVFARAISSFLPTMIIIASCIASLSLITAHTISSQFDHVPPGPTAILLVSILAFMAIIKTTLTPNKALDDYSYD